VPGVPDMLTPMRPIGAAFLVALGLGLAVRWWLASRQIAAARAHRERVPEPFAAEVALPEHQKAADYCVARVRLGRIEAVIDAVALLALTVGGGISALDALWRKVLATEPWHGALVIASVLALLGALGTPFSLWRTFRVEAAFGFNRTTLATFALDRLKGIVLALLIGGPLLLAVLALMQRAGSRWWLYAWLVWICLSAAISWAWPAFIAPLFNRFSPLSDAALKARIEALLERCGFTAKGVFVVDSSRRTAHGNAYFTGLGRNKRIVFFDSLIGRLAGAEIEAVLAHELGHFRLRHVAKRLTVMAAGALGGLALLALLARLPQFYTALGVEVPSAHAALLLFMLVAPVFTFFLTPLETLWSRHHEFAADRFAARYASASQLATALVKLYRDNATTLTPDPISSAFYDSHPPALARIAYLRRLALAQAPSA